jgi:monofunctional glycosyltransferase
MSRWLLLGFLLVMPFVALGFMIRSLPDVDLLNNHYPQLRYLRREDGGIHIDVKFSRSKPANWVDIESVPGWVQGAIITSEDWAFFQHSGFDFNQIRQAVEEKVEGGRLRGASTLSQQLVKNVFLSHDRSWVRKVREAWLTYRLERRFSKRKIFEFYLNVVEWGEDVVGLRQAAQHYFSKTPSTLSPRESAYLAHLLPNPRRYSAGFYRGELSAFSHRQIQRILDRSKQAGYITDLQWQHFRNQRLPFEAAGFAPVEIDASDEDDVVDESDEAPLLPSAPSYDLGVPLELLDDVTDSVLPPEFSPEESVDDEALLDIEPSHSL